MRERVKADEDDVAIGAKLKAARERKGLSLVEVEGVGPVSAQQLHKYENGSDRVRASMLLKLARIYKCSIAELYPRERR